MADFTLARFCNSRPANASHSALNELPLLHSTLCCRACWSCGAESVTRRGVRPGVFIEIKHADYFRSIGLPMDIAVGRILESMGLTGAESGVFVECFEADVLNVAGAD